jgi:hypothetical protein
MLGPLMLICAAAEGNLNVVCSGPVFGRAELCRARKNSVRVRCMILLSGKGAYHMAMLWPMAIL